MIIVVDTREGTIQFSTDPDNEVTEVTQATGFQPNGCTCGTMTNTNWKEK